MSLNSPVNLDIPVAPVQVRIGIVNHRHHLEALSQILDRRWNERKSAGREVPV